MTSQAMEQGLEAAEYILPLRWADDSGLPDLVAYLHRLATWIPVIVVDGSAPDLFARHREQFPPEVRHIRPDHPAGRGHDGGLHGNGKVAGVMTGVRAATAEILVIADDDVRYTRASLAAVVGHLGTADVVRPQNYFDPLPWHACWDTSRTLINRAWSADFPGTLALRRSALLATDGYEPVLFENLELIRTVIAAGGREKIIPDLFVARRPPRTRHFLKQRVRQAYDDFAQPRRLAAELALLPAILGGTLLPRRARLTVFLLLAAAATAVAGIGRRRLNGTDVFPLRAVWFAPLWAMERAVCIWCAVAFRLAGGVPYAGARLRTAAHTEAELRRRHQGKLHAFRQQQTSTSTAATKERI
ncbi:glycosyltransferase [Arthrobacter sp. P2b]|uniref:glycosyltransferase n=1 Tax=Arthrobacter sp. P2b TaxID=1938741 RepID=UPI0009CB6695|nr:glycosyltransferase family 2 protein [Arthrobacter sp. P2b]SLJ92475.1 Glycosyl transferase family 21 [Arthrobacter sp. P2b]